MSDSVAIAAVTATLRTLVQAEITHEGGNPLVTTLPPDKAQAFDKADGWVNLFLYHTQINAAWRNKDLPRQVKPNETGNPPMGLDLFYLLTAYEKLDNDPLLLAHRLLGRAMLVLHDHPVLSAAEIRAVTPKNDLADQIERLRVTPVTLPLEELSKLWMIFQTGYRISAAYQVSVVLIDSRRASRAPLPVLSRGPDDRGAVAQGDLIPPFPAIEDVRLVDPGSSELLSMERRVSFELGDKLALLGHHFGLDEGDMSLVTLTVRLSTSRLAQPQDLAVAPGDATDQQIVVQIPNDPANFPAGFYTVSVLVTPNGKPDETRTTNEWSLLLAPQITNPMPPPSVARINIVDGLGQATINLTCAPDVRPEQRVALALGDREVRAAPHTNQTNALTFVAKKIGAGTFRVRLRVDGVDSHIVDFTDPAKPQFLDSQKVTIT
ncbi:MAG: DUF4255 domain-containing protein [Chthoniobacterales bacterium]